MGSFMEDALKNKGVAVKVNATTQGKSILQTFLGLLSHAPSQISNKMVKPFDIRSIEHDVTIEGIKYHIEAANIKWLDDGRYTFADFTISRNGIWEVKTRLLLTYRGEHNNCEDVMIGAFAQARMAVNRELIRMCLLPIQNQILEIERTLKNFS